ncbi:MAG: N-acetylmuramoyl-L-alanine amidase [Atribacterota bacterium]|nr:N-acetylmuramoyl-L-alanine amidase [Atribacterota bacterium]
MKRTISCLLIIIFILFIYITISLANTINVREYLEGRFPAIYAIYLATLGELDIYEIEFIDLLEELPEQEQRVFVREVHEKGFSLEILEKLRMWQEEIEKPYLNVAFPSQTELTIWNSPLYVFGTTDASPDISVTVNDEEVQLHDFRTGNFLTVIDIPEGERVPIVITAARGNEQTSAERTVFYPRIWEEMPTSPLTIHSTRMQPQKNQELRIGDEIRVMFQGSPEAEASFQIGKKSKEIDMKELLDSNLPLNGRGIYKGSYTIKEEDLLLMGEMTPQAITVTLHKGDEKISKELPGKVSVFSKPSLKVVEVAGEQARIHRVKEDSFAFQSSTLGGDGLPTEVLGYYLLPGTLFEVTGTAGDYLRVKLGENNYLIHEDDVREVQNSPQNPGGDISKIRISENSEKVTVVIDIKEGIPFLIKDDKNGLRIVLYGMSDSNNIIYQGMAPSLQEIKVEPIPEEGQDAMIITVGLYQSITGFDYQWSKTGLEISICKSPEINSINPIQGHTIVVDPGHGGNHTGAIGPGNVHEKDVVLEIGKYLKDMLEENGAKVLMTRSGDVNVDLYERIDFAVSNKADLFISIHANAHAVGADAVNYHGHMTIYNFDFNEILAEIMMEKLISRIGLPLARVWQRSDLVVLRRPQIPSVMIETAFMMHPEDNWYLLQPAFQKEFAAAIMEGIIDYFQEL